MTLDKQPFVDLLDEEIHGLIWAARRGAHELRGEGWQDMKRNAEILDSARSKLEAYTNAAR